MRAREFGLRTGILCGQSRNIGSSHSPAGRPRGEGVSPAQVSVPWSSLGSVERCGPEEPTFVQTRVYSGTNL